MDTFKDIDDFITSRTNMMILLFLIAFSVYYQNLFATIYLTVFTYLILLVSYLAYNLPYIGDLTKKALILYIDFFRFITPDYLYKNWSKSESLSKDKNIITEEQYKLFQDKNLIRDKTSPNNIPDQSNIIFIIFVLVEIVLMIVLTYIITPLTSDLFNNSDIFGLTFAILFSFIIVSVWMNIFSPTWSYFNNKLVNKN
jgi:hypothetical protein